jgi:hypothetical protein
MSLLNRGGKDLAPMKSMVTPLMLTLIVRLMLKMLKLTTKFTPNILINIKF